MTPHDRLQRLLIEHRTAHDPASSEREILGMFEATLLRSDSEREPRPLWPDCWCETCDINLNGWQAARAAALEEAAEACESEAENWRGEQSVIDFLLCAARIRALKEKE